MTTATTTTMAAAPVRARRSPRAVPSGVPRWLWLLGVTVQRLDAQGAWVVSAGGGTVGVAAVLLDAEQDTVDNTREDRS
jgi:hypothetical protein